MDVLDPPVRLDLPLDQLDGSRILRLEGSAPVDAVREGLPVGALDLIAEILEVSNGDLSAALDLAPRTLTRRRRTGRLSPEESDRLLRLARVVEVALAVFEDVEATRSWFVEPKRLLGGESPLQRTDTAPGTREIEDMLFAIEFSAAA